jgi:hypothetical protein
MYGATQSEKGGNITPSVPEDAPGSKPALCDPAQIGVPSGHIRDSLISHAAAAMAMQGRPTGFSLQLIDDSIPGLDDMEGPAFAPAAFAQCECELVDLDADAPICTHFEDDNDPDCPDTCTACRHGERCHLKGHVPNPTPWGGKMCGSNTCTECQWGDACGVVHPNKGMLAEDKDGWFCVRCGHAPECHKPIACEFCNGSGGIASACRCPCGGAE